MRWLAALGVFCALGPLEREPPLGEVAEQAGGCARDGVPGGEDEPLGEAAQLRAGVRASELVVGHRGWDPQQPPCLAVDHVLGELAHARTAGIDSVVGARSLAVEQVGLRRVEQAARALSARAVLQARVEAAAQLVAVEEVQEVRGALPELGDVVLVQLMGDVLREQVLDSGRRGVGDAGRGGSIASCWPAAPMRSVRAM